MDTTPRILIIEDDLAIRATIKLVLEREGFIPIEAASGSQALSLVAQSEPTLVLLDLMLPDMNGLDVCREIRRQGSSLPVIVLSGKTEEIDKVVLLELGADDYITKPFSPRELVARIRAVLRRAQRPASPTTINQATANNGLRFGAVVIRLAEREVTVNGKLVQLTPTEFDLIACFANNPGVAMSRDQLISHIWGYDSEGETRLLDSHIAHLRAKLESDPANPRLITTVRNIGYKLSPIPPVE